MASFNDCLHLASRTRSSSDAPESFRVSSPLPVFGQRLGWFYRRVSSVSPSCFLSAYESADRSARNGDDDDYDDASFVTEISDSTPNLRHPYKLRRAPWPRPRFACKKRNLTGGHNLEYIPLYAINHPSTNIRYQVRQGVRACTEIASPDGSVDA